MDKDWHYPRFDCARVRRPFCYEGAYARRGNTPSKPFKVNRRLERFEMLEMFAPKDVQALISGGYIELYPKTQP